jgi:hypothetical protein
MLISCGQPQVQFFFFCDGHIFDWPITKIKKVNQALDNPQKKHPFIAIFSF